MRASNEIFGEGSRVKYLRQDKNGNIWYAMNDEVGVLWIQDLAIDKNIKKMAIPELSDKLVNGFEFVLPIDEHNVLFATEKGVIHFDPAKYRPSLSPPIVVLSEVWLKGMQDSLLFGGHSKDGMPILTPELTHRQNALEFVFSSTDHEGQEFVRYAHQLEGAENNWSAWDANTSLSINNLRPGNYTLLLKAKNKSGQECEPISYGFTINPPWYASVYAYSVYGLLLVGAFIGLAFYQNKKHEKEKAYMETAHMQEQEKKEALVQGRVEGKNQPVGAAKTGGRSEVQKPRTRCRYHEPFAKKRNADFHSGIFGKTQKRGWQPGGYIQRNKPLAKNGQKEKTTSATNGSGSPNTLTKYTVIF